MEKLHAVAFFAVALVVVLAAIAFYPALFPSGAQQHPGSVADVVFTPFVKGCLQEGEAAKEREGKRGETPGEEVPAAIVVNGNNVTYSRATNHYCCLTANVGGEVGEGKISIIEKWGGSPCRCMCFSELGATSSDVPPGDYLVEVYRIDAEGRKLLLSQNIRVG